MTDYLLDTNVVSEAMKARPNPGVTAWLATDPNGYLSVLTVGELKRGAYLLENRNPLRSQRMITWIDSLLTAYDGRILDVDKKVMITWARLPTHRTLPALDSLLAATALTHDLTVATRNVKDFADTGVATLNPFSE